MLRHDRWMVSALILVGVAPWSVGGRTALAGEPATLEKIAGSDLMRVVLTQKAAERLAIATEAVREEPVMRWMVADGEVEDSATLGADDAAPVLVRVPLPDSEDQVSGHATLIISLGKVTGAPEGASVLPLSHDPEAIPWSAQPVGAGSTTDVKAQYYEVNATDDELAPGQHVQVRTSHPESGVLRKVIPYSAVFYDTHGNTWTYTNPELLVFVRQAIDIEHIQGDLAILQQGSAVDGAVVTAGAAELWGIESKFGGGH